MRDTVRGASDPAVTTAPVSFARRHPILTGFGVLAGLSLFAAYFPLSAIVTAALVGARAAGADRIAVRVGQRVRDAVLRRWRAAHPAPAPPAPMQDPRSRQTRAPSASLRGRDMRALRARDAAKPALGKRRASREVEAAAAPRSGELEL